MNRKNKDVIDAQINNSNIAKGSVTKSENVPTCSKCNSKNVVEGTDNDEWDLKCNDCGYKMYPAHKLYQ